MVDIYLLVLRVCVLLNAIFDLRCGFFLIVLYGELSLCLP
jgi:hypothetical protein